MTRALAGFLLTALLLVACRALAAALAAPAASDGLLVRLEAFCAAGSPKDCARLAEALTTPGSVVRHEPRRARLLFDRACRAGVTRACHNLAVLLESGDGGSADAVRARELYRQGCEAGLLESCGNLAVMLTQERGGPPDQSLAREVFGKLCDPGSAQACFNLGAMLWNGQGGEVDQARAAELFDKACEGGFKQACEVVKRAPLASGGSEHDRRRASHQRILQRRRRPRVAVHGLLLHFRRGQGLGGARGPGERASSLAGAAGVLLLNR